jgi:hypothetical protein
MLLRPDRYPAGPIKVIMEYGFEVSMARRAGVMFVLVMLSGCGMDDMFVHDAKPVAVTGSVSYRGYIVNGGWISFTPETEQGDVILAEIMSDGTFRTADNRQHGLHPGRYRMSVRNHHSQYGNLPQRYADPVKSGLKCVVTANQPLRLRVELD